jgi:hypothetical protein
MSSITFNILKCSVYKVFKITGLRVEYMSSKFKWHSKELNYYFTWMFEINMVDSRLSTVMEGRISMD